VYGYIGYGVEVRGKYAYFHSNMFKHFGGETNAPNMLTDGVSTIVCESGIILCLRFIRFSDLCASLATINLLKPTGYGMHQQVEYFNNCTLCPYSICVFCICLRTNTDLCHLHKN
jgi:hypothetical protein